MDIDVTIYYHVAFKEKPTTAQNDGRGRSLWMVEIFDSVRLSLKSWQQKPYLEVMDKFISCIKLYGYSQCQIGSQEMGYSKNELIVQ